MINWLQSHGWGLRDLNSISGITSASLKQCESWSRPRNEQALISTLAAAKLKMEKKNDSTDLSGSGQQPWLATQSQVTNGFYNVIGV